jgi:predicted nicotinamide N-methyase
MSDEPPGVTRSGRLAELHGRVAEHGPLATEQVVLPRSGVTFSVVRPADTDHLLDQAAADPEQNLPYWAEIWPSGVALADEIARDPSIMRAPSTLELGAGLGITACAALLAAGVGDALTVTDYAPAALDLCRLNTLANTGREPRALQLNWRHPNQELFDLAGGGFAVVLAADVLYERRDVAPLLALFERLVAPGGLLWLAEPGRQVATAFLTKAREIGWSGRSETHHGPWPDPKDACVVVSVHRLRRA